MRIGITTDFRHSAFSSGNANTAISIASILRMDPANEVILLYKEGQSSWWSDITELQSQHAVMSVDSQGFDLIIEVSFFLTASQRSKVGRCVWYCRKQALFTDLESSVYGRIEGRNLEGISAIWLADIFNKNDDLVFLQTLYPGIPISTVPWVWTPDLVETHRRSQHQSPVWFQINSTSCTNDQVPWSIHVSETNVSTTSSCTLPLTILRYLFIANPEIKSRITVHNMDILKESQFFKDNVLKHCSVTDPIYTLMGRQRVIDWVYDPKSIILSHSRFVPFTMANLEAIWVGIPLVHNSIILRDLGHGLEKLYYPKNSIRGAVSAIKHLMTSTSDIGYVSRLEDLTELRKVLLYRFFPQVRAEEWSRAINSLGSALESAIVKKPSFTVLFSDMWADFNDTHNMFLLALENGIGKKVSVQGFTIHTLPASTVPDLVVFGPFGEEWKSLPESWPKVHFTGENTSPNLSPSVKLNIGYNLEFSNDTYLRMPLWQFEIDWFGADPSQIRNPIPLPIDVCTKSIYNSERTKFCAFVVTNPRNPIRNQAFHDLSAYKQIDSAGRLFNNIGSSIFAGLGGGGGELIKHEFLKNYRFCLAYENDSTPGYTTEKLLHAKAAGCVPIYWGDPKVGRDFNEKGFLNASGCKTAEDLRRLVSEVDSNPGRYAELASVPALSVYTRDLVRRNFSEMVRRFLIAADRKELLEGLEPFLGAKTTEEARELFSKRSVSVSVALPAALPVPLFVTGATQNFWPSVVQWLDSLAKHRATVDLHARVYVGADVSDSTIESTKSYFTFATFVRFPTEVPEGFPDFWDPQHYAWKLWIYNTVVHDPSIEPGKLVFYMDAGSVLVRWPIDWMEQARSSGLSFLDDCRQQNRSWCHADFCKELQVSEEELAANQIAACLLLFVTGHPTACKVFSDALKLGQKRSVVVGKKWAGISSDGNPFGHRHDQSILSILSQRSSCPRYPIDKVYGDKSARATFHNGQAVYVHRGNFRSNVPVIEGIDDVFVINLDRRQDRKQAFLEAHPDLRGVVRRLPAYDGRTLRMTSGLASLFKTNDFFWKKAVMGCALSHLKLWSLLSTETSDIQHMLILEDDVRLQKGWRDAWSTAYRSLPENWDCVYLGGILPPNRAAFANTLERVGPGLARVAPNSVFGQRLATRYFHFCAYAYVLSRRGAKKILDMVNEKGYWTSADHIICNQVDTMNLYVVDPLVAGASQDDDPRYQTAEFNNFSRVDNFDSDLWNNDERFSKDEIDSVSAPGISLNLVSMFSELDSVSSLALPKRVGPRYISLKTCLEDASTLYEAKWLDELLGGFCVEAVSEDTEFNRDDDLIVVVIRDKWAEQYKWLSSLRQKHTFKILHVGDEHAIDPIEMYSWPEVKKVLRTYSRSDLNEKTLVIPLGYYRQYSLRPNLPFRDMMWSFVGTDWKDRSKEMQILRAIEPHSVEFYNEWRDPKQLEEDQYISLMLNSKFIPCPRGQNTETYRFYEALECGSIPLFIIADVPNTDVVNSLPFIKLESWEHAAALMQHFQKNPEQMEQYRSLILHSWTNYKTQLKEKVRAWLKN